MFSTCIRYPLQSTTSSPVVFVQYLAAMAIVEGIKSYDRGYKDLPVKLKWPNDICIKNFTFTADSANLYRCVESC
jgi:biotin--protein ligase